MNDQYWLHVVMRIHTSPKHIPEPFEDRKTKLQHILDVNLLFRARWRYCGNIVLGTPH